MSRPVAVTLIDRIIVYQDKRIEVVFKYQYNYERVLDYIGDVQGALLGLGGVAGSGYHLENNLPPRNSVDAVYQACIIKGVV